MQRFLWSMPNTPSSRSGSKKDSRGGKKPAHGSTWPDFWINLTDKVYDLANSGNLLGLVLLGIVVWIMLTTYKMPAEQMPWLLQGVARFISGSPWPTMLLAIYGVVSTTIFREKFKIQRSEIQRLTDLRKELIHGLENETLRHIQEHKTSGFDLSEGT